MNYLYTGKFAGRYPEPPQTHQSRTKNLIQYNHLFFPAQNPAQNSERDIFSLHADLTRISLHADLTRISLHTDLTSHGSHADLTRISRGSHTDLTRISLHADLTSRGSHFTRTFLREHFLREHSRGYFRGGLTCFR